MMMRGEVMKEEEEDFRRIIKERNERASSKRTLPQVKQRTGMIIVVVVVVLFACVKMQGKEMICELKKKKKMVSKTPIDPIESLSSF